MLFVKKVHPKCKCRPFFTNNEYFGENKVHERYSITKSDFYSTFQKSTTMLDVYFIDPKITSKNFFDHHPFIPFISTLLWYIFYIYQYIYHIYASKSYISTLCTFWVQKSTGSKSTSFGV